MKRITTIGCVALAGLATAAPATTAAPTATAAARQFEGRVVSVNRDARTFRLRDAESGTVRIKVTSRTRYERIAGFSGVKRGLTGVEATVKRSGGRWVATLVERSGGGGGHGGHNGADD